MKVASDNVASFSPGGRSVDCKTSILNLVQESDWRGFFKIPRQGVIGYPLLLSKGSGRADFCFEIGTRGRLFIEDEDSPNALNNLLKYWRWCADHPGMRPVHLIHLMGNAEHGFVDHCRFLKSRIEEDLRANRFQYHIIALDCHRTDTDLWIPELGVVLDEICGAIMRRQ